MKNMRDILVTLLVSHEAMFRLKLFLLIEQSTHVAHLACHYFGDILIGGDHSPQLLFVDDGIGNAIDDASIAILGSLSELYRDTVAMELQGVVAWVCWITASPAVIITGTVGLGTKSP